MEQVPVRVLNQDAAGVLATADNLAASGKRVTAFVTYDKRLGAAAVEVGLTVAAPGAE
jgi:hypothetical protein